MAWNPESKSIMDFLTWGDILGTKINVYIMIRCSWGSKCKFVQLYVPTRETSPAAKSEEKRLFSQARTIDVFLISPSVNRCRFALKVWIQRTESLRRTRDKTRAGNPWLPPLLSLIGAQILRAQNLYGTKFWSQKISLPIAGAPSSPISPFSFSFFCFSLFAVFFALAPLSERLEQPTSQQQIRGK